MNTYVSYALWMKKCCWSRMSARACKRKREREWEKMWHTEWNVARKREAWKSSIFSASNQQFDVFFVNMCVLYIHITYALSFMCYLYAGYKFAIPHWSISMLTAHEERTISSKGQFFTHQYDVMRCDVYIHIVNIIAKTNQHTYFRSANQMHKKLSWRHLSLISTPMYVIAIYLRISSLLLHLRLSLPVILLSNFSLRC